MVVLGRVNNRVKLKTNALYKMFKVCRPRLSYAVGVIDWIYQMDIGSFNKRAQFFSFLIEGAVSPI